MADVKIERQQTLASGRYIARIAGIEGEAELIFTRRSSTLIGADHTGAPDSMRGAIALVQRMIADARTEGFKVIPACPYILAQCKRNPEWVDVMSV
jgi:uncharacterized protein